MLIVDDEESLVESLTEILTLEGYGVTAARDGEVAFAALKNAEHLPELILLDVRLPKMDGPTFLREKAKNDSLAKIPVLLVTASKCEVAGVDIVGFLAKPFGIEELLHFLNGEGRRDAVLGRFSGAGG